MEVELDNFSDSDDRMMEASVVVKSAFFEPKKEESKRSPEDMMGRSDASSVCNILDSSRTNQEQADSNKRK
jgi:hypothetical protein